MDKDLAAGFHAVLSVLEQDPASVDRVWIDQSRKDSRIARVVRLAKAAAVRVQAVPRARLDEMLTEGASHQGVIARVKQVRTRGETDIESIVQSVAGVPLILVLDGVQDPHNLGACLRSAAAAGVHAVILPKDKSAPLNVTVRKAASGALEHLVIVQVTNLARALEKLKTAGVWIVGAAGESESDLYQSNLTLPVAIVMGSEGKGLRQRTRGMCDSLVRIPIAGTVESLNVSVATGICLFEAIRQREAK